MLPATVASLLAAEERITFALLLGSFARGQAGPLSDVDIGIYVSRPLDLPEPGRLTVASRHNLDAPASYAECVDLLSCAEYLDEELAGAVASMVGLRNLLVREYVRVDPERLYALLSRLDDFRRFIAQIQPYV
ncbi:MAG: DUF86 domain-containing protein [Oscillochloridaceae bacterium]|nr:DUF86 domain-containing protein [Chloroflexaceae bacterium]MDW8392252.1 DUF86 domain-containing protein [Oscillochloridaceae bacterium]